MCVSLPPLDNDRAVSLNEKRIRLEEERERKRVEREAEIELKRHHLIVKVGVW